MQNSFSAIVNNCKNAMKGRRSFAYLQEKGMYFSFCRSSSRSALINNDYKGKSSVSQSEIWRRNWSGFLHLFVNACVLHRSKRTIDTHNYLKKKKNCIILLRTYIFSDFRITVHLFKYSRFYRYWAKICFSCSW